MYTEVKKAKHLERASKFRGRTIGGVECVTQAVAVQMAEMTTRTFFVKCAKCGISSIIFDGRQYYNREELLKAIEGGSFGKYTSYNRRNGVAIGKNQDD